MAPVQTRSLFCKYFPTDYFRLRILLCAFTLVLVIYFALHKGQYHSARTESSQLHGFPSTDYSITFRYLTPQFTYVIKVLLSGISYWVVVSIPTSLHRALSLARVRIYLLLCSSETSLSSTLRGRYRSLRIFGKSGLMLAQRWIHSQEVAECVRGPDLPIGQLLVSRRKWRCRTTFS